MKTNRIEIIDKDKKIYQIWVTTKKAIVKKLQDNELQKLIDQNKLVYDSKNEIYVSKE